MWGLYETAAMTARAPRTTLLECLVIGSAFGACPFLFSLARFSWILPAIAALPMLVLAAEVGSRGAEQAVVRCDRWLGEAGTMGLLAAAGALYTGVLFPYFALVRNSPHGIALLILMLLLVVVTDSG